MRAPFLILLVEDNPADAKLTCKLLEGCGVPTQIEAVREGDAAMLFLRERMNTGRLPDLILLDLNLPRKDGREVLREIKGHEKLKTIPVVVLTTSSHNSDITVCYELQANSYVSKPVELEQFREMIRAMVAFWLKAATLPSPPLSRPQP